MKIYLHELTENDTDLDFTQEEAWVSEAVSKVDEQSDEPTFSYSVKSAVKPVRPIHVHFNLRKVDEVVVASGSVQTHVELLCSRCANSFKMDCNTNFSGLFCKDPVMAGVAHLSKEGPEGQNKGFARHAHDESKDLDITYLSNDFIDLGEILTEQLQLQVPFQPLCRENCKGMCPRCGTDLNLGRCACAKIADNNPFSVLRDLKL